VSINHSGPYEFIVDTGAQMTIMDPDLAAELKLQPQGNIGVVSVGSYAGVDLVKPQLVETGPVEVHDLLVAVQGLRQIQALNPKVRGILGENFLGRFDLLIDYGRKIICFDESKSLQHEMQGERVPVMHQEERTGDLAYTSPVLVAVHLPGDGKKDTVLLVDSGSSVPLLFQNRLETPTAVQLNHARRGSVAGKGGALVLATMPRQNVKIGSHITRQIAFLTPVSTGHKLDKVGEDGLLPTTLFKRVFISYGDHFVMFEPR
jgi:hypothetical protein